MGTAIELGPDTAHVSLVLCGRTRGEALSSRGQGKGRDGGGGDVDGDDTVAREGGSSERDGDIGGSAHGLRRDEIVRLNSAVAERD